MLTVYDLNNITGYILEEDGPMLPVDIRQYLDQIVRESKMPILAEDLFQEIDPNRHIGPMLYPPMQAITLQLKEWDRDNPGKTSVVHLFYAGSPHTVENKRRRLEWERTHSGLEEIIDHEFIAGDHLALSAQQKEEVDQILKAQRQG